MEFNTPKSDYDHLFNFIGYGNLKGLVWFLGMEEGGGSLESLKKRRHFKEVEDCASAHKKLEITEFHFEKRKIQRTWRGMCILMLRLEGHLEFNTDMIRAYQAERLGRTGDSTFLLELMPIPKPSIKSWYKDLFPQYSSSDEYYEIERPRRIEIIKKLIKDNKPSVVIAYGKAYWDHYKLLFPDAIFEMNDQFLFADINGTRVVLSDHFTARTMNKKFEKLYEVIVKNNNNFHI